MLLFYEYYFTLNLNEFMHQVLFPISTHFLIPSNLSLNSFLYFTDHRKLGSSYSFQYLPNSKIIRFLCTYKTLTRCNTEPLDLISEVKLFIDPSLVSFSERTILLLSLLFNTYSKQVKTKPNVNGLLISGKIKNKVNVTQQPG